MSQKMVDVRLEVTGAGTFKSQMAGAAQSVRMVGNEGAALNQHLSVTNTALAKTGGVAKTALGSFIGFGGAQTAMVAISMGVRALRTEVLGLDQALTESTAIMANVSGETRSKMEQTARSLSIEFGMSATTIGKAFYYLASAGLDVNQSIAAMPQVVAFAKAGMFDLQRATEMAVDAQTAMGLRSSDAEENLQQLTRVTDVLSMANNAASGSIEQFAEAMTNRGAAAGKMYGLTLEETVGLLEGLANTGLKGAAAGESVFIMLRELTSASEGLNREGIHVFDDAGQLEAPGKIIEQLAQKMRTLSTEERKLFLDRVGFTERSRGPLLQILEQGPAIQRFTAQLQGAAGTTQDVAEKQMKSMISRLHQVQAAVIEMARRGFSAMWEFGAFIGEEFGPAFAKLGSIASTVGEQFAPVLTALGGAAFLAAKVAIEGLAKSLDMVGGFLQSNAKLVELLVILYGTKLAIAAVQAGIALASIAGSQLVTWGLTAAAAIETLIRGFGALRRDVGLTRAIMQTALPIVGFAAAAIALGSIITTFQTMRSEAEQTKQAFLESMNINYNSVTSVNRALTESATAIEKQRSALHGSFGGNAIQQGANVLAQGLKNAGDMVLGFFGAGGAINSSMDEWAKLHGLEKASEEIKAKFKIIMRNAVEAIHGSGLDKALQEEMAGAGIALTEDQVKNLEEIYGIALPAADKFFKAKQQFVIRPGETGWVEAAADAGLLTAEINDLGAIVDKAGLDLTAADVGGKLGKIAAGMRGLTPAAQEAQLAVSAINEAADIGTDKVEAYAKALKAVADAAFGMEEAASDAQAALDAMQEAAKEGAAWTDLTDQGRKFQQTARDYVTSYHEILVASAAAGDSQKELADKQAIFGMVIRKNMEDLGLAKPIIDHLLTGLGLSKGQYAEIKVKVKTDTTDIDKVDTKLREAEADLERLHQRRDAGIPIDDDQIDAAHRKVVVLRNALRFLEQNPTIAAMKVDTKPVTDANQKLIDAKNNLKQLKDEGAKPADIVVAKKAVADAQKNLDEAIAKVKKLNDSKIKTTATIDMTGWDPKARKIVSDITRINAMKIQVPIAGLQGPGGSGTGSNAPSGGIGRGKSLEEEEADGGVVRFADGGTLRRDAPHVAQVAKPGTIRVWNEPETEGEAYVPLAISKRARSLKILEEVARLFGLSVVKMADGGVLDQFRHSAHADGSITTGATSAAGPPVSWQSFLSALGTATSGLHSLAAASRRAAPAPGAYIGKAIESERYTQALIEKFARTQANTPSFRGAVAQATAGITDPAEAAKAADEALKSVAKTYTAVAQAAGKSAADQLAASGLVGEGFENAAQKIMEAADSRRQARKQINDEIKATRRQLIDDEFADGRRSYTEYMRILRARLAGERRYSAEWMSIHQQIRSAQQQENQRQQGVDQKRQSGFQMYAAPQQQATSMVGAFSGQKSVTAAQISQFLTAMRKQVKEFNDVIRTLVAKGYATSVVQQIAMAGVSALPLGRALLGVPVAEVNGAVSEIRNLISVGSQSALRTFGDTDRSVIVAPKVLTAPHLQTEKQAGAAVTATGRAYNAALTKYRTDSRAGNTGALARDMADVRRTEKAYLDAQRAAQATSAPISSATVTTPPARLERAPGGVPVPYAAPVAAGMVRADPPPPVAGPASKMVAQAAQVDRSLHVTIGQIPIDLRGQTSGSPEQVRKLVKAGVSEALTTTFAKMERDLRSGAKSSTR